MKSKDIVIIVPKGHELLGLESVFDIPFSKKKVDGQLGEKGPVYYEFECKGTNNESIPTVLVFLNEDGNDYAQEATNRCISQFSPKIAFLIGTAAGNSQKTKIGDVVVSDAVYSIKKGGNFPKGKIYHPKLLDEGRSIVGSEASVFTEKLQTGGHFSTSVKVVLKKSYHNRIPQDFVHCKADLHFKFIASGDDYQGSKKIINKVWELDSNFYAYDMESDGFWRACSDHGIQKLIVRGISDYGYNRNKNNRTPATISAAVFLKNFIENAMHSFPYSSFDEIDTTGSENIRNVPRNANLSLIVKGITDSLTNSYEVKTMWSFDWSFAKADYIKKLLSLEYDSTKGTSLHRIMLQNNIVSILEHILLHLGIFTRQEAHYNLYVPHIDQKAKNISDVLIRPLSKFEFIILEKEMIISNASHMTILPRERYNFIINDLEQAYDKIAESFYLISSFKQLSVWLQWLKETSIVRKNKIIMELIGIILNKKTNLEQSLKPHFWNAISSTYIQDVPRSHEFLQNYDQAGIDVVCEYLSKLDDKQIVFIDVGCGVGDIVNSILTRSAQKIPSCVLIDFSRGMLKECGRNITVQGIQITKEICDARQPCKVIQKQGGKTNDQIINEHLKKYRRFVCLFSLIPNHKSNYIIEILKGIKNSLRKDDVIFVASYNGEKFSGVAYDVYSSTVSELVGDLILTYDPKRRFFASYNQDSKEIFHSRWYTSQEIMQMFKEASLDPKEIPNEDGCFIYSVIK